MFVLSECYGCRQLFTYNPDLVPSIPIGPDGQPHPDGERMPICQRCVELANPRRLRNGLDLIVILPGAYEPQDV